MKEKKIFENFQKFFCTQVKKISHFKHSLPPLIAWFKKIPTPSFYYTPQTIAVRRVVCFAYLVKIVVL